MKPHDSDRPQPEHVTGTPEELTLLAAARIILDAHRSVRERGFFAMALSGGSSPKPLYRILRQGLKAEQFRRLGLQPPEGAEAPEGTVEMPWEASLFFWGDERCVPPESQESNFRMARETLFEGMDEDRVRLFRMEGEDADAGEAARRYEQSIRQSPLGAMEALEEGFPVFDLVLLGLGPDGHTASLFPVDRKALEERDRWVVATEIPDMEPRVRRLTLTLPVLERARTVLFFSPSEEKAALAASLMNGERPELPAAMLRPHRGRTLWLTAQP